MYLIPTRQRGPGRRPDADHGLPGGRPAQVQGMSGIRRSADSNLTFEEIIPGELRCAADPLLGPAPRGHGLPPDDRRQPLHRGQRRRYRKGKEESSFIVLAEQATSSWKS